MFMFDLCKEDGEEVPIDFWSVVMEEGLGEWFSKVVLENSESLEFTRLKDCGSVVPVLRSGLTIPRLR